MILCLRFGPGLSLSALGLGVEALEPPFEGDATPGDNNLPFSFALGASDIALRPEI